MRGSILGGDKPLPVNIPDPFYIPGTFQYKNKGLLVKDLTSTGTVQLTGLSYEDKQLYKREQEEKKQREVAVKKSI